MWILIISLGGFILQPVAFPTEEACIAQLLELMAVNEIRLVVKPASVMVCAKPYPLEERPLGGDRRKLT